MKRTKNQPKPRREVTFTVPVGDHERLKAYANVRGSKLHRIPGRLLRIVEALPPEAVAQAEASIDTASRQPATA